jgi:hypothetical protein
MLAKQNTGGNAAKFFQGANAIFKNSQDRQGPRRNPRDPEGNSDWCRHLPPFEAHDHLHLPNSVLR